MAATPKGRSDTLRPPAPGREETVTLRTGRPASTPPRAPSSWPAPPTASPSIPPRSPDDSRRPARDRDASTRAEEAAISRPSRRPPASLQADPSARIDAIVRELARCGPESDVPLRRRLLAIGPDSVPALARAFPGALWVDLARPHRPLESARQVSAVAACLVDFGDAAAPHVAALLRAPRAEARFAAALVAADLAHPSLVRPLVARLWDEAPVVRNAARAALHASSSLDEMRALRAELIASLEGGDKVQRRMKAVWILGQLRDREAAPLLIEQLASEPELASLARRALSRLVGRDLGRYRLRWRAFFHANGKRPRVEWLVDALDQADVDARLRAFEELVLATGEAFDRRHAVATREGARDLAAFYRRTLGL